MRKRFFHAALIGSGLAAAAIYAVPPHGPGHVHGLLHGPGHVQHEDCPLGGHGCGGMAMVHQAFAELNLTEAQREAIHDTLITRRFDIAAAIKPVIESKAALHNAFLADDPDDAAIRTAAAGLGKSIGDAAVVLADIKVEAFDSAQLTAEQLQKLAQFRAKADASVDTLLNERIPAMLKEHDPERE